MIDTGMVANNTSVADVDTKALQADRDCQRYYKTVIETQRSSVIDVIVFACISLMRVC